MPFERFAVLVGEPTLAGIIGVIEAGGGGCIPNGIPQEALRATVEALAADVAVFPMALARALVEQALQEGIVEGSSKARLSHRQWQVLTLLEEGLHDFEIARTLGVSRITVRRHLSDLSKKIGESGRAFAARHPHDRHPKNPTQHTEGSHRGMS